MLAARQRSLESFTRSAIASKSSSIGGVVLTKIAADGTGASLSDVFDLGRNPLSLLTAAVFGLTPALLFPQLEKRADDSQNELTRTTSGSGDDTTE